MTEKPLLYGDVVNYKLMDPFKIACQQAAITTAGNIERFERYGVRVKEVLESRGESAYEIDMEFLKPTRLRLAHVEEGLGTKNEISRQMREIQAKFDLASAARTALGKSFHRGIGKDNGNMILNDLGTRGASPISFLLHVAAYPSDFFADEEVTADIIAGTLDVCNEARCSWGGGESPALRDIINSGHALLSGSAIGISFPDFHKPLSENNLHEGLRIVLLEAPGPNANGITLLRTGVPKVIAQKMMGIDLDNHPERVLDAYTYQLPDGKTYGEAVLTPTPTYSRVVDELIENGVPIEYAVHISGHGWRKLMRAQKEFSYVMDQIPESPAVFKLLQEASGMSNEQIYGDYNMGAGFAVFVEDKYVAAVKDVSAGRGLKAWNGGAVEEKPKNPEDGRKRVVIKPAGVTFKDTDLQIR